MIRLALAQALIPEAAITIRNRKGHFRQTPDLRIVGRLCWFILAIALVTAGCLAMGA